MVNLKNGENSKKLKYPNLDYNKEYFFEPVFEFAHDPFNYLDSYKISNFGNILNKRGTEFMSPSEKKNQVMIFYNLNGKKMKPKNQHVHRIVAFTFLELPEEWKNCGEKIDVDHIISEPKKCRSDQNHNVLNLQFLPRSIHNKKTGIDNPERANKCGKTQSKPVKIIESPPNSEFPVGTKFSSTAEAGRKIGLNATNIANSCRTGCRVKGFKFEYLIDRDLPGEIWTEIKSENAYIKKLGFCAYSNLGRVQFSRSGIKTYGNEMKGTRYRRVGGAKKYVHRLLMELMLNRKLSKSEIVMHTNFPDEIRRDENGYERNYPCDLKVGTQSENIQEWHDNERKRKRELQEIL